MKKLTDSIRFKEILPHLLILFGFVIISLALFYPVLSGKKLIQSDIQQYKGMSKQLKESRENGKELYWIDNAFGGMPTYQLGAKYPFDFLTPIHRLFQSLPHPTFLVFLYFLGCYVLLLSMRIPIKYAVVGALAYGLSTYLLIIIQVGHNTKAQALGYLPFVLAGVQLIFRGKYFWGFALSTLAIGLQIRANHYQMTYYLLLLLLIFGLVQFWVYYKKGTLIDLFKKAGIFIAAGILALGLNATALLTTSEYTKFSTRGKSELTLSVTGEPLESRTGLSYDYITEYSYGIFESLSLIAPRIQGGGSRENLGTTSKAYEYLIKQGVSHGQAKEFSHNVPTYWGNQPILEAPAYVGIIVIFLALLSLFLGWSSQKRWLFFGIILSLALSWGKNFSFLTQLFIDYVPFYSKFRAVSSIQVILEFAFPVLAVLGLYEFFEVKKKERIKALKNTTLCFAILGVILFLVKSILPFESNMDSYYSQVFGPELMQQIYKDRKSVYSQDVWRLLLYVGAISIILWLYLKEKFKANWALGLIFLLLIIDLGSISNRYLNRDLFTSKSRANVPFIATKADLAIQRDTSHYRVYEPALRLAGARTSYFHNAVGGYHGAKPRRYEEIFDLFEQTRREEILNILNVKYILYESEEGVKPLLNPEALGNAWFTQELIHTESPDETYQMMSTIDFSKQTVTEDTSAKELKTMYSLDTLAKLILVKKSPDFLRYESNSSNDGFAIFSEIYYPSGWEAYIDGVQHRHFNVNYILRGMSIPKGEHIIEFKFNPPLISVGSKIQLTAFCVFLGLLVLGIKKRLT